MSALKRVGIAVFILIAILFFARERLYNQVVIYRSLGPRTGHPATNALLIKEIELDIDNQSDARIDEIIQISLSITSKHLHFTVLNTSNDPNVLFSTGRAHCVGYVRFFAATCNYLLERYGLDDQWIAQPTIGQLYVFNTNIHKYLNSPFLRDHDFVVLENLRTGEIVAVDPTLNDYLKIDLVKYAE
ncbi:hypothetical protein [Salinimicrobium soli]|uniref:hypothetical protein n=1 Tax=Salinimicrobium soli TaxID=1254399 RepID=UPI003AAECA0D